MSKVPGIWALVVFGVVGVFGLVILNTFGLGYPVGSVDGPVDVDAPPGVISPVETLVEMGEPSDATKAQEKLDTQEGDILAYQVPGSTKDVEVDFRQFRQLLPLDAINPIYRPQFVPGELDTLDPGELVIGVEINGESKAYPVGPLNRREMVNDVVGGVPVLVTW